MAHGPLDPETGELIPRDSTLQDVVQLCRELHSRSARFILVGGYAVRLNGLNRSTYDVDLLIDTAPENEQRVFDALATLPDGCVRELDPGDVVNYAVVRVADEILVDLMASASGLGYEEASRSVVEREIEGVKIPFAGPELLYRMKKRAGREKDRSDIHFLEQLFAAHGRTPPEP